MSDMGDLRQLIRVAAHDAGGYRGLARRSRGAVSASTLNNLVTGRHSGKLKDEQLSGVAMAVGRPAREIAEMLGQAYADPAQPFVLPTRANILTRQQRKVVLSVVDAILQAGEGATAGGTRTLQIGADQVRPIAQPVRMQQQSGPRPTIQRAARTGVNRGKALQQELDRLAEQGQDPPPEDEP